MNGVARQLESSPSVRSGRFLSELFRCNVGSCRSVTCRPVRTAHRMIRPVSPLLWSVQLVIRQTTEAELCASEQKISCILRLRGVGYSVTVATVLLSCIGRAVRQTDRQAGDISCKMCLSSENFCVFLPTAS